MVARTTRTLEGQRDVQSGPLPATSRRVVDCHHSRPGGRILLSAGLWRAVLLPPGQRLPAPGKRAPDRCPRYLTVMTLSLNKVITSIAAAGLEKGAGPPKTALSRAALTHYTLRARAGCPLPTPARPTFRSSGAHGVRPTTVASMRPFRAGAHPHLGKGVPPPDGESSRREERARAGRAIRGVPRGVDNTLVR